MHDKNNTSSRNKDLSIRPGLEVLLQNWDQRSSYEVKTRDLTMKTGSEVLLQGLGQKSEHEVWIESQT